MWLDVHHWIAVIREFKVIVITASELVAVAESPVVLAGSGVVAKGGIAVVVLVVEVGVSAVVLVVVTVVVLVVEVVVGGAVVVVEVVDKVPSVAGNNICNKQMVCVHHTIYKATTMLSYNADLSTKKMNAGKPIFSVGRLKSIPVQGSCIIAL